jgi:hypothetical protein
MEIGQLPISIEGLGEKFKDRKNSQQQSQDYNGASEISFLFENIIARKPDSKGIQYQHKISTGKQITHNKKKKDACYHPFSIITFPIDNIMRKNVNGNIYQQRNINRLLV